MSARAILIVLAVAAAALTSCGGIVRYQVTKTPTADCVIRSNGEFCDEEERLPSPTVETWAVETVGDKTILYVGDETWIADGTEGRRTVVKVDRSTQSLCTTTRTRTLTFEFGTADDGTPALTGTLDDKIRVEGPDSCGETPFGSRRAYFLGGVAGGPL